MGLKHFATEPGYVLQYLKFLTNLNDTGNVRATLERAVKLLPANKSKDGALVNTYTDRQTNTNVNTNTYIQTDRHRHGLTDTDTHIQTSTRTQNVHAHITQRYTHKLTHHTYTKTN